MPTLEVNFHLVLVYSGELLPWHHNLQRSLLYQLVSLKALPVGKLATLIEGGVEDDDGNKVTDGRVCLGDLLHLTTFGDPSLINDDRIALTAGAGMTIAVFDDAAPPYAPIEQAAIEPGSLIRIQQRDLVSLIKDLRRLKDIPLTL